MEINGTYDNQLANPYSLNAGPTPLAIGVIAWSFGTDGQSGSVPGPAADKNAGYTRADDVISWQCSAASNSDVRRFVSVAIGNRKSKIENLLAGVVQW